MVEMYKQQNGWVIRYFQAPLNRWMYLVSYRPNGQCRAVWSTDYTYAHGYSKKKATEIHNILKFQRHYNEATP